jgi:AraC family transcriptional regulator
MTRDACDRIAAGDIAQEQANVRKPNRAGDPSMDVEIHRSPVDTLAAIERSPGVRPIYRIANSQGAGLFAAKWKLDGAHLTTGDPAPAVLVCRTAGMATVTRRANGEVVRRRPTIGSVTFIAADTRAEWSYVGSCESIHVYIDRDVMRRFVDQSLPSGLTRRINDFFAIADPWLKAYFEMLMSEFEVTGASLHSADPLFLGETEHLLIHHLVRWHSDDGGRHIDALRVRHGVNPLPPIIMRRVMAYVESNLADNICLQDLADIAHMSAGHFLRAFRVASGTTPYHYVLEQRLQRARSMLAKWGTPVSRVAAECGFKTLSHLSAKFHARFCVSPSRYRAAMLAQDLPQPPLRSHLKRNRASRGAA